MTRRLGLFLMAALASASVATPVTAQQPEPLELRVPRRPTMVHPPIAPEAARRDAEAAQHEMEAGARRDEAARATAASHGAAGQTSTTMS